MSFLNDVLRNRGGKGRPPGSAGVPPASLFPAAGRGTSACDVAGSGPLSLNRTGKARVRPRRSTEVEPRGGDGRGRAEHGAGGTPALPGGHPPHRKPGTWLPSCPVIGRGAWFSDYHSPLERESEDKGRARGRSGGGRHGVPWAAKGCPGGRNRCPRDPAAAVPIEKKSGWG